MDLHGFKDVRVVALVICPVLLYTGVEASGGITHSCEDNQIVELRESHENNSVECYVLSSSGEVHWSMVTASGQTTDQGSCQGEVCTSLSPLSPDLTVERKGHDLWLHFRNVSRDRGGATLVFWERFYGTLITSNCTLDVIYGFYDSFIRIYPVGSKFTPRDISFRTGDPELPVHNCHDLTFIPENGEVPCVCGVSSVGSPEGRLIWYSGDAVLAAGDYGDKQLWFPSNIVDRRHDGMEKRCQLDWVVKEDVYVTRRVAYGPDRVELRYWPINTDTETARSFVIVCTVLGVSPLTPDMIQWGGPCQGQTGFTCTVSVTTPGDAGREVTCTATNAANNHHSVRASVRITVSLNGSDWTEHATRSSASILNQTSETSTSAGLGTGIAIGAGAVFGVAVAFVAILLTVLWKQGRLSRYRYK
ncbi:hypothetical protein BaRGS_00006171 [Batillaria attramentaria]|uniref:Uncharacterized protein n=1 Tax=Batillaria attramentaria TaxID=370345 RepID=A0ABD0LTM4_9CAEN